MKVGDKVKYHCGLAVPEDAVIDKIRGDGTFDIIVTRHKDDTYGSGTYEQICIPMNRLSCCEPEDFIRLPKAFARSGFWVARDEDGAVAIFNDEPAIEDGEWYIDDLGCLLIVSRWLFLSVGLGEKKRLDDLVKE